MTKSVIMEKTLLSVKGINRYNNERFPMGGDRFPVGCGVEEINSPLSPRRRFVSCPPSPTHRRSLGDIPSTIDVQRQLGDKFLLVEGMSSQRRHTLGQLPPRSPVSPHTRFILNNNNSNISESRRSSGASSIIDVIEECESDQETDDSPDMGLDYLRCINCSRSNSTNSLGRMTTTKPSATKFTSEPQLPQQQIINFCYKCRHLNPNPHLPAFYEGRRSSWTAGENVCYSPRNSRRSSLTSSLSELPMISEPSFDEETNDTVELKLRVEQEVDRLTKLNNKKNNLSSKQQMCVPFTKHLKERLDRKVLMMSLRETNL